LHPHKFVSIHDFSPRCGELSLGRVAPNGAAWSDAVGTSCGPI
jgi:hypothetical protein